MLINVSWHKLTLADLICFSEKIFGLVKFGIFWQLLTTLAQHVLTFKAQAGMLSSDPYRIRSTILINPSLPPKLLIVNQVILKKKDGATPPSQMAFFLFHQFCWWDDDDVSNGANICQQWKVDDLCASPGKLGRCSNQISFNLHTYLIFLWVFDKCAKKYVNSEVCHAPIFAD